MGSGFNTYFLRLHVRIADSGVAHQTPRADGQTHEETKEDWAAGRADESVTAMDLLARLGEFDYRRHHFVSESRLPEFQWGENLASRHERSGGRRPGAMQGLCGLPFDGIFGQSTVRDRRRSH